MNGSAKQVKWAEDIQRKAVDAIMRFRDELPTMTARAIKGGMGVDQAENNRAEFEEAITTALAVLDEQTDAEWWIARSHLTSAKQWMREALAQL